MDLSRLHRQKNRLLAKAFTALPGLASKWAKRLESDAGKAQLPWSTPSKPLCAARVAVVTTGGVHLKSQIPFDMADQEGDPTFRAIPVDTPSSELEITHDYYNHADARKDINLVLPVHRLLELQEAGVIGKLHETALSFMGHIDGRHLKTLTAQTARKAGKLLRKGEVDYALLVPA